MEEAYDAYLTYDYKAHECGDHVLLDRVGESPRITRPDTTTQTWHQHPA